MAVRIVTDSTCDLPAGLTRDLEITVVPLTVSFGAESFLDGVDLSAHDFFRRMRAAADLPKTSQPPVSRFVEAYAPLLAAGHEIVSIHLSEKLSGTLNSARLAAEQLPEGARITIVDSRQVSLGLGGR
jgi:DegV family protein with EDD domain